MKVSDISALYLNEKGKRKNNEDSVYPFPDETNVVKGLYLVCDGVGGEAKGEVASHLACMKFAEFFFENGSTRPDEKYIDNALEFVERSFDEYITTNPDSYGMATTVTLIYFHDGGVTLAHVGDSRIYHIRGESILFSTRDHSLINQLIDTGKLTAEDAIAHPHKNVITRAVQGAAQKQTFADVACITDIKREDYFFLCTDGILESFTDTELAIVIGSGKSDQEVMEAIRQKCTELSKDNFSACLLRIDAVVGGADEPASMLPEPIATPQTNTPDEVVPQKLVETGTPVVTPSRNNNNVAIVVSISLLIIVGIIAWFFLKKKEDKEEPIAVLRHRTEVSKEKKPVSLLDTVSSPSHAKQTGGTATQKRVDGKSGGPAHPAGKDRSSKGVLDRDSLFNQGNKYNRKDGDYNKAKACYEEAAKLGHAEAAYALGMLYEHGTVDFVPDAKLGKKFYEIAAGLKHKEAIIRLRLWYQKNKDTAAARENFSEAYKLMHSKSSKKTGDTSAHDKTH